jgi:hypothetical protein
MAPQEINMSTQVPSDAEILKEVADLLLKHLGPAKSARFWAIWQSSQGDFQEWKDAEFGQMDVNQLNEAIVEYQARHIENDAAGSNVELNIAHTARKPSLFGSVEAGDVTEAMIDEAKRQLFRPLPDL